MLLCHKNLWRTQCLHKPGLCWQPHLLLCAAQQATALAKHYILRSCPYKCNKLSLCHTFEHLQRSDRTAVVALQAGDSTGLINQASSGCRKPNCQVKQGHQTAGSLLPQQGQLLLLLLTLSLPVLVTPPSWGAAAGAAAAGCLGAGAVQRQRSWAKGAL